MTLEEYKAIGEKIVNVKDLVAYCDQLEEKHSGDKELVEICAAIKKAPDSRIVASIANQLAAGYGPTGKPLEGK